jgi:nitrite reductase/ring-hydroxylating ferredoxin subunit
MADVQTHVARRKFLGLAAAACACALCPAHSAQAKGTAEKVDVGLLSDYPADGVTSTWAKSDGFFLVRGNGRIIAVSTACPHNRANVVQRNGAFRCPGHGAAFAIDGSVTKGPAKTSLLHLAIESRDDGHLIVDPDKKFGKAEWDSPGSYIDVKESH